MSDNYYDSEIEKEQKNVNVYARLVDIAMNYLEPKNNRKQNNLSGAWLKVKYAKDGKERNARLATFLKVLREEKAFSEKNSSSMDISRVIRDRFKNSQFDLEYSEISRYASDISFETKESVAKYARAYVDSLNHIESLRRQKERDAKMSQERAKKEEEEALKADYSTRPSDSYSTVYATVPTSRTRSYECPSETIKVGDEVIYHDYDEFEVREQKTIQYIEKKIEKTRERGFGKFFFTTEEEKMIEKVLGEGKYVDYHVSKMLEEGLALQDVLYRLEKYERDAKIPFKKSTYRPNLNDILESALTVLDNLPEELMSPTYALDNKGKYEVKLRNLSGMSKGLETYKKIYAIYINYFNKLSDQERENIKATFMNDNYITRYKKEFNIKDFEIVTPTRLEYFVNAKVKEKILDNYTPCMDTNIEHFNALTRATTYMSVDDLTSLYHAIKTKYNTYATVYPGPDEEQQRKAQDERRKNLQENFAKAILSKMNLGNLSLEERNKKLEQIVKERLHEDLRFELSTKHIEVETPVSEPVQEEVTERTIKSEDGMYHYVAGGQKQRTTNPAMAARYNAQHRFFGMSKLEQTIAKMNGKWAAFRKLWDQAATMDKTEQEEVAQKLDLMFRR